LIPREVIFVFLLVACAFLGSLFAAMFLVMAFAHWHVVMRNHPRLWLTIATLPFNGAPYLMGLIIWMGFSWAQGQLDPLMKAGYIGILLMTGVTIFVVARGVIKSRQNSTSG
jgi:hypothetical protein